MELKYLKYLFTKDYFIVFSTDQVNYHWRLININLFCPITLAINQIVDEMKKDGETGIALIKIEKI